MKLHRTALTMQIVYYPKVCEAASSAFTMLIHCLISKSLRSCTKWLFTLIIHGLISQSLQSCTVRLSQCLYIVYYPKVCEAAPYCFHNANTLSNIQKSAKLHYMAFYIDYTWSNIPKSAKLHRTALTMFIHSLLSKSLRNCTVWLFAMLIHGLLSKSLRSCTIWLSQC